MGKLPRQAVSHKSAMSNYYYYYYHADVVTSSRLSNQGPPLVHFGVHFRSHVHLTYN